MDDTIHVVDIAGTGRAFRVGLVVMTDSDDYVQLPAKATK
jgi:hypothetical protein